MRLSPRIRVIGAFIVLVLFVVTASYILRREMTFHLENEAIRGLLWVALAVVFTILLYMRRIRPTLRNWALLGIVVVMGVILGASPEPNGALHHAVVDTIIAGENAYLEHLPGVVIIVIMMILAGKIVCGWACQLGTLQDLIFRLNRRQNDRKGILRQFKIPFAISNTIRVLFLIVIILAAVLWSTDILDPIEPFNIYEPVSMGVLAILLAGSILILSLFVYRPWCFFFCPLGLIGWLLEKVSIFKIHVDYDACTACEVCSKACPSQAMEGILKRQRMAPDCFTCGTCISVCPTECVSFTAKRRKRLPQGLFEKRSSSTAHDN